MDRKLQTNIKPVLTDQSFLKTHANRILEVEETGGVDLTREGQHGLKKN